MSPLRGGQVFSEWGTFLSPVFLLRCDSTTGKLPLLAGVGKPPLLCQQLVHDVAAYVGEAELAALELVDQTGVVQA